MQVGRRGPVFEARPLQLQRPKTSQVRAVAHWPTPTASVSTARAAQAVPANSFTCPETVLAAALTLGCGAAPKAKRHVGIFRLARGGQEEPPTLLGLEKEVQQLDKDIRTRDLEQRVHRRYVEEGDPHRRTRQKEELADLERLDRQIRQRERELSQRCSETVTASRHLRRRMGRECTFWRAGKGKLSEEDFDIQVKKMAKDDCGFEPRDFQLEAAYAAYNGQDSLIRATTGGGKSLCFQLFAMLCKKLELELVTIVVEPFIETICSQVRQVRQIDDRLVCLMGTAQTDKSVEKDAMEGKIPLVYMCPESFNKHWQKIHKLDRKGRLGLVVVDEVQSVWGMASWRPGYGEVFTRGIRELSAPKMLLSASLLPGEVRQTKETFLGRRAPHEYHGWSYRSNLKIEMMLMTSFKKDASRVKKLLKGDQQCIVYVRKVEQCEWLSRYLSEHLEDTVVVRFHKNGAKSRHEQELEEEGEVCPEKREEKMTERDRTDALQSFQEGRARVMVATISLCMGIDIHGVKGVIVYDPSSFNELYQQIGRAGRSGEEAWSYIFHKGFSETARQIKLTSVVEAGDDSEEDDEEIEALMRVRGLAQVSRKLAWQQQAALTDLFGTGSCLWKKFSEYFDDGKAGRAPDLKDPGCGKCTSCRLQREFFDAMEDQIVEVDDAVRPILQVLRKTSPMLLGELFRRLENAAPHGKKTCSIKSKSIKSHDSHDDIKRKLTVLAANDLVELKYRPNLAGHPYALASITDKGWWASSKRGIEVRRSPLVEDMKLAKSEAGADEIPWLQQGSSTTVHLTQGCSDTLFVPRCRDFPFSARHSVNGVGIDSSMKVCQHCLRRAPVAVQKTLKEI